MLEFDKMRVTDLKKICKEKGLPTSGTKSELIERLQTATEADADDDLLNDDDALGDTTVDDDDDDMELKDVTPTKEELPQVAKVIPDVPASPEISPAGEPAESVSPEAAVVKINEPLSEAERLAKRAERFGALSEQTKKALRAERFGSGGATKSSVLGSADQVASDEKLKQRAERFGTVTSSTGSADKPEDVEKLKQRAERFGSVTSSTLSKVDSQEKMLKRKMRFGAVLSGTTDLSSDAAKKSRAERFGIST